MDRSFSKARLRAQAPLRRQALTALFIAGALACGSDAGSADRPSADGSAAPAKTMTPTSSTGDSDDVALNAIDDFINKQQIDKSKAGWKTRLPKPSPVSFDSAKSYNWILQTNKGPIKIKLMPEVAPMHATSTIYLTRLGFYDDVAFHRVISGFMAQGGDPLGRGTGGPGYKYDGEFDASVKHDRPGLLSMANAGPGTDGSQFFLTFVPTPHLDGKHTIFGEVVEGMDTVKTLESLGSRGGRPSEPLKIESATVVVE